MAVRVMSNLRPGAMSSVYRKTDLARSFSIRSSSLSLVAEELIVMTGGCLKVTNSDIVCCAVRNDDTAAVGRNRICKTFIQSNALKREMTGLAPL